MVVAAIDEESHRGRNYIPQPKAPQSSVKLRAGLAVRRDVDRIARPITFGALRQFFMQSSLFQNCFSSVSLSSS
jgi:hypothetical protein